MDRTHGGTYLRQRWVLFLFRQSETSKFHYAFGRDSDRGWSNLAVYDLLHMRIVECLKRLTSDFD